MKIRIIRHRVKQDLNSEMVKVFRIMWGRVIARRLRVRKKTVPGLQKWRGRTSQLSRQARRPDQTWSQILAPGKKIWTLLATRRSNLIRITAAGTALSCWWAIPSKWFRCRPTWCRFSKYLSDIKFTEKWFAWTNYRRKTLWYIYSG